MDLLHAVYERLIHWIFSRRRYGPAWLHLGPRGIVLAVGVGSFVGALALAPVVGSEFIPQTDNSYIQLNVRLPVGISLERASAKIAQVESVLRAMPEVRLVSSTIGDAGNGSRNQAALGIQLTPRLKRARTQKQVEDAVREALKPIPGIDVSVGDRPIFISLLGPDTAVLEREIQRFADKVATIKGIADLETSVKPGLPAYAVRLKPDAVRELGLTPADLAASLRAFVNGDVATYWTAPDGEQVEVELRLPHASRENIAQLEDLPVAYTKEGTPVALSRVAEIVRVVNPEVIKRQDLQRRHAVYAGVKDRPSGDVGNEVKELARAWQLPPGYRFDIAGQTKDQEEAFAAILAAISLSVIFIYIVLASQFGSFVQPVAIMASLPLALIGVMLALLVTRSTLNLFSMIGLIMLMGLVTKNAILLVDFANHARRRGASVADALLEAGMVRMRPIMMTTAAMVFGMLPLALALDEGGEIQASMGRAIIGGVITSTLLTLVVVPVLYSFLVRERRPAVVPQAGGAPGAAQMPASPD